MIFKCPFCRVSVDRNTADCPSCRRRMIRRCPACSEDISAVATICKYCGEAVERPPTGLIPVVKPVVEPPKPIEKSVPKTPDIEFIKEPVATIAWEEPRRGVLGRWWNTMRDANFNAPGFFARMPKEGGFTKPIGFVYAQFLQVVIIGLLLLSLAGLGAALSGAEIRQYQTLAGLAGLLAILGFGYGAVAGGLFISAAFWHVVSRLFGGNGSYESTFRVVGYSTSSSVWSLIPYVGPIVAAIMHFSLLYHGLREVHSLPKGRALTVVFMPMILGVGLMFALAGCLIAACASC